MEVLEQFFGQDEHRTIFNIECDSDKDISKHSFYQNEDEMLMYPARQFQVISSLNATNQLKIIRVKEIQPPFLLIPIPLAYSSITSEIKEIEPSISLIQISHPSSTNSYQNEKLQHLIEQCKEQSVADPGIFEGGCG